MNTVIFRVTESVGNSCLSMRRILSVNDFNTQQDAENYIKYPVMDSRLIDVNRPYIALTKVENGCAHSCINFYQNS